MVRRERIISVLWVACGSLVLVALVTVGAGMYLYGLSRSLPDLSQVKPSAYTPQNTIVYAADGSVLAEWHGDENRRTVTSDAMPTTLKRAVVAIEDRRFYVHDGVDMQAILRAAKANADAGGVRQGGSTITQQLVKLVFTRGERTLTRKIKEALLAYDLEDHADKDEVLAAYLNTVYFGNGAYGVESAARRYFDSTAPSLTLSQSALLAGIIRSPAAYDPIARPQEALARRNLVLQQMRKQGYITSEQERAAAAEELLIARSRSAPQFAPHFVEYVKAELVRRLGPERVYSGGLNVHTTLEPEIQRSAERAAKTLSGEGDPAVALVALRHSDGSILAMVGGPDYKENQFNLATQGRRQPGSAFKPFVLVAALEDGVKPSQAFKATPLSIPVKDGVWNIENYENSFTRGSLSLHAATNWSVNAVYARLIMRVGPQRVADVARKMGIVSPLDPDPAIALGGLRQGVSPLEMASSFGTLANGGVRVAPSAIALVTNDDGRRVLETKVERKRVLDKRVATEAALMLHDVVERGTGQKARMGRWAAGKTGTTQSYRDAWFVGWSGGISTAVWVGHPEAQIAMTDVHGVKVTGGSFPAQIWSRFMRGAVAAQSGAVTPSDYIDSRSAQVKVVICRESMKLGNKRCTDTVEISLAHSLVPRTACTLH